MKVHFVVHESYEGPQLVLVAAGIGSLYPLKQLGTGILLILLTLFNAVMGLQQEGKAAAAVAALQKMVIIKAGVRQDGQLRRRPRRPGVQHCPAARATAGTRRSPGRAG